MSVYNNYIRVEPKEESIIDIPTSAEKEPETAVEAAPDSESEKAKKRKAKG